MSVPKRIQRSRVKGWRMPDGAVYVGRPTKWGNPWKPENFHVSRFYPSKMGDSRPATLEECVAGYREDILSGDIGLYVSEIRAELKGKDLACWCALDSPCHADVLLELANSTAVEAKL